MTDFATKYEPYGPGRRSLPGSLADPALMQIMQRYRTQIARRYVAVIPQNIGPTFDKRDKIWVSAKMDGELWFALRRGGHTALVSYNGRVLEGLPLVDEIARQLGAAGGDIVVAGELVAIPETGRPRSHHVGRAFAEPSLSGTLRFFAFDVVEDAAEDAMLWPWERRLSRVRALFEGGTLATAINCVEAKGSDVGSYFREWTAEGKAEGVVVRIDSGVAYKVKAVFSIDAVVVAFGERTTEAGRQMREMSVAVIMDDGTYQLIGSVGGGFPDAERTRWLARLDQMSAPSKFRMANREGTLCRFVKPEIVVEIQLYDLLDVDAEDEPVRRMALRYTPEEGYMPLGEGRTAAMLFPVFLRERTDKVADAACVGMSQITSRVSLADATSLRPADAGLEAKVVERAVWTKEAKGSVAVRKYVILDTNRQGSRDSAPFTVFFTDFSAGRAEPLQVSLRTTTSFAGARQIAGAWVTENIKKGWIPAIA